MNKAIVFGGSGFIGSHLVEELLEQGFQVLNFDTVPWYLKRDNYKYVNGSMLDAAMVSNVICKNYPPQVVYNLAGISDIDTCQKQPLDVVRKNVLGNQYILQGIVDAVEQSEAVVKQVYGDGFAIRPKYIFASSLYVYSKRGGFYASGKRACEDFIRDYQKEFGIPFVILRYGTIYGPRATQDNSIRRLVSEAFSTGVISYYGTGAEVREYVHVKDVAKASVKVLDEKYENSAVMISGMFPVKAEDMIRMLRDIMGSDYKIEFRGEKPLNHYEVTPYAFSPDVVVKLDLGDHRELAGGLMDVVKEVHDERSRTEAEGAEERDTAGGDGEGRTDGS